jgi:GT2 family glycosyltransferase
MSTRLVSPAPTVPLTVVMPTHGRTELYLESLASLERQSLRAFELVVTDDSPSWDDRQAIQEAAMSFAARTGRPTSYLFSEARLGQARNTNQGLRRARGTYVRILHSDDLLAPRALEAELALLADSRLNIDLLYHLVEPFKTTPRFDAQPVLTLVQPTLFFRSSMHSGTPLPSATVFHRRLLEEVGVMREDLDFLCDWEFFVRLLASQHRRQRHLGRLSPGFVGWRVHEDSTTGQLWDRHFLEHERFMLELENEPDLAESLIGDRGTRDGFFATAVRYRYRRLAADVAGMSLARIVRSLPRIARCAFSPPSLRARLRPAPWTRRGQRAYPHLVVPCEVPGTPAAPRRPTKRSSHIEPRAGLRFALSAHVAGAIIGWGKRLARASATPRRAAVAAAGPEPLQIGGQVEIASSLALGWPKPGIVRVLTEYNNSINLWSVRHLVGGAESVAIVQLNSNAFTEPVLHQCLKFVRPGGRVEVALVDNQHLTSFGFKSLIERLFPDQFQWIEQSGSGPAYHVMRFERRRSAHPSYTAPHTGWTFGMLTTGKRLENVERFIDSVEAYCDEPYEVILVSPVPLDDLARRRHVRVVLFDEHDDLGWITRKKNLVCSEAIYSDICVCHDRFSIDPYFTQDVADWGYAYGVAAPRVRLADGRRGLDWAVVSSQNHVWSAGGLLDYRAYSQYAYIPGGATLIRKTFWRDFPWNENLFWNEHEDVELCRRVQRSGGLIALSTATIVATEDRWIDRNPRIPYCDQNEVLYGRPVGEQRIHFLPTC